MLTAFGKALRKLRVDKGLRLLDLANLMGQSVAFISALETGRKSIPDGFVTKISQAMKLKANEIRELRRAADRTRKEVRVDKLSEGGKELVAAFARQLDDIPDPLMEQLKKIVLKVVSEEQPFKRKRRGIVVPPLSTKRIRGFAEKVRSIFCEEAEIALPIMDILEFRMQRIFPDFYLDVRDRADMGDDEGRVMAGENCIALRDDIYTGAWGGKGRDRFTASHELGHYLMHREIKLARARDDGDAIFTDSEWQADTFAGTLLLSPRHLPMFDDADHAADECNMTYAAAGVMWKKYQSEGLISSK